MDPYALEFIKPFPIWNVSLSSKTCVEKEEASSEGVSLLCTNDPLLARLIPYTTLVTIISRSYDGGKSLRPIEAYKLQKQPIY